MRATRLWAISDLHLRHPENRSWLSNLAVHDGDWIAVAGDVGETEEELRFALGVLARRFARVLWTPGNHELWTLPRGSALRGEDRYRRLVDVCREYGALTPEDEYPIWPGPSPRVVASVFTLYDYSFRPDGVAEADALEWAMEHDVLCTDEVLLDPHPHASRAAWCAARCAATEPRLEAAARVAPVVLITHYPTRADLVKLPRIPRFSLWCGTRRTEDWHRRFRIETVVYGHLHVPGTIVVEGTRFEEVSLGYPENWRGRAPQLREILPGPATVG